MKHVRTVEVITDSGPYIVGDVISFNLADGEEIEAIAVAQESDGVLFVLVDCLVKEYPMFKNIGGMDKDDITYMNSDLRKALNGEILARFPEEIRCRMVAVNAEGDLLRIPSEKEIFGENVYGQAEDKKVKRWKPMKKRRNRIAFQGKEGAWEWYWLINRHQEYASLFALVSDGGLACSSRASYSHGVRLVFKLK